MPAAKQAGVLLVALICSTSHLPLPLSLKCSHAPLGPQKSRNCCSVGGPDHGSSIGGTMLCIEYHHQHRTKALPQYNIT
jgi:hypothetical protein